jgi:hypothetical protein
MITATVKKQWLLGIALFVCSVSVFTHEKGDITINPEFQSGLVFPVIIPDFGAMGIDGNDAGSIGFDYAGKITVHYFFRSSFSANIGAGVGGLMAFSGYDYDHSGTEIKVNNTYRINWVSIPFGIRHNIETFVMGGGFEVHIPFDSFQEQKSELGNTVSNDTNFRARPFLGWYLDLGIDLAGRENKSSGFGAALRVGSSFSDIAGNTAAQQFVNFGHANISLLLNYMFKAGRL